MFAPDNGTPPHVTDPQKRVSPTAMVSPFTPRLLKKGAKGTVSQGQTVRVHGLARGALKYSSSLPPPRVNVPVPTSVVQTVERTVVAPQPQIVDRAVPVPPRSESRTKRLASSHCCVRRTIC